MKRIKPNETLHFLLSDNFQLKITALKGKFIEKIELRTIRLCIQHNEQKFTRKELSDKNSKIQEMKQKILELEEIIKLQK